MVVSSGTMAAARCLRYKLPCHMQQLEKVSIKCVVESVRSTPGSSI